MQDAVNVFLADANIGGHVVIPMWLNSLVHPERGSSWRSGPGSESDLLISPGPIIVGQVIIAVATILGGMSLDESFLIADYGLALLLLALLGAVFASWGSAVGRTFLVAELDLSVLLLR